MFSHYADLLRRFRGTILAAALGAGALACAASLMLLEAMPLYRSAVTLNMQPSDEALRFNATFRGVSQFNPADIISQSHVERLLSRPVAERALDILLAEGEGAPSAEPRTAFDRLKAAFWRNWALLNYGYFEPLGAREEMIVELREATEVEVVAGSYILRLEVTYDDPGIAARAANALARAYVEVSGEEFAEQAGAVDAALAALAARTEEALSAHRLRRRTLERELAFESPEDGRAILLGARTEARLALALDERRRDGLRERLERIGEVDTRESAALAAEMREAEEATARRLRALAEAEAALEALDRTEAALIETDRRIREAENDLEELQGRRISAELAAEARLDRVRVVDEAVAPVYPAFPKVLLNTVVATVVGALLAMAPIVAADVLDDRIRTGEDLRRIAGARALPTTSPGLVAQARRFLRGRRKPAGPLRRYAEATGRRFLAEGPPRWPEAPVYVTGFAAQEDVSRLQAAVEAAVRCLGPSARAEAAAPQVVELVRISRLTDWSPYAGATVVIGVAAGEAEPTEVERAVAAAAAAGAAPFLTVLL